MLAQRPASRLIRAALLIMLFVVSFRDGIERPELVQARLLQRPEMQLPLFKSFQASCISWCMSLRVLGWQ